MRCAPHVRGITEKCGPCQSIGEEKAKRADSLQRNIDAERLSQMQTCLCPAKPDVQATCVRIVPVTPDSTRCPGTISNLPQRLRGSAALSSESLVSFLPLCPASFSSCSGSMEPARIMPIEAVSGGRNAAET